MTHRMEDGRTSWVDEKGNLFKIADFEARIIEEHQYIDGNKTERYYLIEGLVGEDQQEPVLVAADQFPQLAWATNAWGSQAVIFPRPAAKDLLRTAIQLESNPLIKTIYTHTGWININNQPHYLSNNCAINAQERISNVEVQLPLDLARFCFPIEATNPVAPIKASLDIARLGPPDIIWPLLASVYRAPIAPSDFAIHLSGRTGTFKSEIASLLQSHWGYCNARELPASWSSTGNALEALAYRAKDALLVCDDFIPMGTSWQVKSYQRTADQIIRAQGNQAGRARLTDKSMLQQTMYPRGLIFSTGEDTPEGHSVRARMLITEISPGDVEPTRLSGCQKLRALYSEAMAHYIQWLARDLLKRQNKAREIAIKIRDSNLNVGHARTPPTMGELIAGIQTFLEFAIEKEAITMEKANEIFKQGAENITKASTRQVDYLTASDPADQFVAVLRSIFASNSGHAKARNGGIPKKALVLGWTTFGEPSDIEFKPHGPRLGWTDDRDGTLYLDATVAYDCIRRHSRGSITITRQTLYKRLREAGLLSRVDVTRQRNTIRMELEGATRNVLALHLNNITEGD